MNRQYYAILFLAAGLAFGAAIASAHDGHVHAAPKGVQAMHGGFLQAAEHIHSDSQGHSHGDASKRKFFFEVVYNKDGYRAYVHKLKKGSKADLESVKPGKSLRLVKVEQVNPRRKKDRQKLTVEAKADHWVVTPVKIRGKRTLLNMSVMNGGENFQATVQVERR